MPVLREGRICCFIKEPKEKVVGLVWNDLCMMRELILMVHRRRIGKIKNYM